MKPEQLFSGIARLRDLQEAHEGNAALMDIMRPRFNALRTRHEDGTAPRAVTAFNLFQTPEPLAARMAELADLRPSLTVLEPSAGLGRLIRACAAMAENLQITAIEEAATCARELFNNEGSLKILQRDFMTVTPEEVGLFDRVIMNPPFKMRRDIKHINHALSFLRPGGTLTALCLATEKRRDEFEAIADHFEEIPAKTFRGEGTDVPTYLFKITKPLTAD